MYPYCSSCSFEAIDSPTLLFAAIRDLLGFGVGNASQVDLALEIIRGVNGTQFFFDIEGDQISTQLDITRQILGTLPVLFGGSYGDQFDADTISAQLIEQLDGAGISSAEVLIENSVESVIANFFQFGNTAPLTPPVMMWSTPKVFSVSPGTDATGGGVCRDVHGWLEQIDKEVAASKRHIYEALDGGEYNHRMSACCIAPCVPAAAAAATLFVSGGAACLVRGCVGVWCACV
jgi:hypothetical protein